MGSELLEQGRVTLWLLIATAVTTLCGSFQYGYQVGVLTGPSQMMQDFYNESNYERRDNYLGESAQLWLWSTTVSAFCIGGAVGALVAGYLADRLGRKGAMLLINVFSITGGLLMGLSYVVNNYEIIIIGRLVIGVYCGASVTIVPVYLAEIAPVRIRGSIGVIHQLALTIGILMGQVLGLFVFDYETGWPILLALTAVPSVFQLVILPFCPESPRWLFLKKQQEEKAENVMKRLRATSDVSWEMKELRREADESNHEEKIGILTVLRLRDPLWKMPLIVCIALHVGQQFSGINAVLFYATEIYYQTGMDPMQVAYSTVGTGAVNVIMTFVAVFVVESAGRRPLLLFPYASMTLATGLLTMSLSLQEKSENWKWLSLILIYLYIVSFSIGPGPIAYVMVPELWGQGPRPSAMSISVQANWFANFIMGLAFPYLQDTMGPYAFLIFMFFCLLTTIFVYFYVPETKGRTFEDIVASFSRHEKGATTEEMESMNMEYHQMS